MQVTVFGASGSVGQLVVEALLANDYQVVVFIHRHDPFEGRSDVIRTNGSIDDAAAVAKAVQGSQAIISTLGSWGTSTKNIVSTGTAQIIAAMTSQNVRRLITLTGASAWCAQDAPSRLDRLTHRLLSAAAGKILNDGEQHLKLLEASSLDWTCLRSPVMTNQPGKGYILATKLPSLLASIPRAAVVKSLVDQLKARDQIGKAPVIKRV